jgi:hypothetical protein
MIKTQSAIIRQIQNSVACARQRASQQTLSIIFAQGEAMPLNYQKNLKNARSLALFFRNICNNTSGFSGKPSAQNAYPALSRSTCRYADMGSE